jgi:hypothetical protein
VGENGYNGSLKKPLMGETPMESGADDLKKMTSRQLLDLRQTLEKARDDKLALLKHVEAELMATVEKLKKVQTAYYKALQEESVSLRKK